MIFTISGQYGSGGNEIGRQAAEKLGYRILDSELVIRARELFDETTGGECPEWWPSRTGQVFNEEDDIPVPDTPYEQASFKLETDLIASTEIYEPLGPLAEPVRKAMLDAQTRAILEYIEDGDCIILGKCSNFVLRGREDVVNIFTKADLKKRIARIMNLYNYTKENVTRSGWNPNAYRILGMLESFNMTKKQALKLIETTDHRRASCYEFITGEKWGDESKFDYIFDGSKDDLTEYVDQVAALAGK